MSGFSLARLVTAALLVLAILPLPYGYYGVLRLACFLTATWGVLVAYGERRMWAAAFAVTALVFNPFIPVLLERETWAFVDIAAVVLMLVSVASLRMPSADLR